MCNPDVQLQKFVKFDNHLGTTKRNVESQLSTALHDIKRMLLSLLIIFL